jgi:RNA polymerase sigma-70 factor (ECF subfamily)
MREHFAFVWRCLRRCGLRESDADDVAQQVFLVLNQKLQEVRPGEERAFLYGTARYIAARWRRSQSRRQEEPEGLIGALRSKTPTPDEALEQRRAWEQLAQILECMSENQRDVFILHEVEQLTMAEVGLALGVAAGTVASRLRRARATFQDKLSLLEGEPMAGERTPDPVRLAAQHG